MGKRKGSVSVPLKSSDELVPYPVRISRRDLGILRAAKVDIPEYIRSVVRQLASDVSKK